MKRDDKLASLPFDDEGKIDGFQFGGRQRAIAEWREKKEQKEFKSLCHRLYQANYQRRYYHEKPGVKEASQARLRKMRRQLAPVRTCINCGSTWVNVPGLCGGRGKPPTRYCSRKCRIQWHNKELVKKRSKSGFWKTNWRRWKKPKVKL